MLGTLNIKGMLACPVCGNDLNGNMDCTFCHRKYTVREGVYVLIDRETSGIEWRWDRRILGRRYRSDVIKGYRSLISTEVREAQSTWWDAAIPKVETLSGTVVDLATGLGTMLEQLLERTDATVIATDIDPNVLLSTKRDLDERFNRKATYVATDARHIAMKEGVADHIASYAGVNNIVDPGTVVSELYRILKPGGTALLMSAFVNRGTRSAFLADDYGFLDAYIEDRFLDMLENSGFTVLDNTEASSVIWRENEMDIFPIDGDMVYYHVVEAQK